MKKITTAFVLVLSLSVTAQITTIPDENIDPFDSLEIIFDPSGLDLSVGHQSLLKDSVDAGASVFIWTWKPSEHPSGHPYVNGLGSEPWKNSNDTLQMTKNVNGTFSWKIVPTVFYGVDAATIYAENIHFLIKTKDGGGYGNPDVKTDDQIIAVDPPATERNPFYSFPEKVKIDDVVTLRYENWREEKASMQNLAEDDCYAYAKAVYTDGTSVQIENAFNVGTNLKLNMEYVGDSNFEMLLVPTNHFNLDLNKEVDFLEFVVMKKNFVTGADRVTDAVIIPISCQ